MKRMPFKRGDIIQHEDRSVYIVLRDEHDGQLSNIAVVCETMVFDPEPDALGVAHTAVCRKIGEVE